MTVLRRSFIFALMLTTTLVIAACGDALTDDNESDDSETGNGVEEPSDSDSDGDEIETPEESATDEEDSETSTPEDAGDDSEDMTPESEATDESADETPTDAATETDDDATEESDESTSDEPDADEILENAAERAEELETAQFEVSGTGTLQVEEIGEVSLGNAEGAVERPDMAQIDVRIDSDAAEIPLSIVSVEDEIYFTDVFTGEWQEAPDEFQYDPSVIFDDEQGIPALIRTVEDAEVVGNEEIDGRQAYQVYGVVDQDTIEAGTSGMFQPQDDVDFNVWIDQETWDVLQVRAEDPTEETDSVWEIMIFGHDEPVEIEDPRDDS